MRNPSARLAALAVVLLLPACGDGASATTDAPDHVHPTGPDDVVLSIDTAGGLVSPLDAFADRPELLVLGDGRVIVADERGLRQARVGESEVQRLLRLAGEAGLLDAPPDYEPTGDVVATDGPTTAVVLRADGEERTHAAYLLGSNGGAGAEEGPRARLDGFIAQALDLVADLPTRPLDAAEVRLLAAPTREPGGTAWPVDTVDLAAATSCVVVAGPAAPAVLAAVGGQTSSVVRQGERRYRVAATPVLPGEEQSCAGWTGS